jgi:hypothetical protein
VAGDCNEDGGADDLIEREVGVGCDEAEEVIAWVSAPVRCCEEEVGDSAADADRPSWSSSSSAKPPRIRTIAVTGSSSVRRAAANDSARGICAARSVRTRLGELRR